MTMTLQADCELCTLPAGAGTPLWRSDKLAVVLVEDAAYPGFCRVIWNDHVKEMTDLTQNERSHLMEVVWQVELAQREIMQPEKINLASLGNMTPHLHWHVIPRYLDDAHFPDPVWAAARRTTAPAMLAARHALLPQLGAAIAARLTA